MVKIKKYRIMKSVALLAVASLLTSCGLSQGNDMSGSDDAEITTEEASESCV
ncbi:MAG: hypothetical protein K6E27_07295 [Eubacterium sp.]|nr:hypothetical protein [Eubacterium sp.]